MAAKYNNKSGSVKRLLKEAQEIAADPCPEFSAAPLESDLFEWHFTIRVPHTDFEGGIYHGRMLLPQTYPLAPPDIMLLTPNGRFELHKKICLSISGYHHETWQPAWGVRTALLALSAFFETEGKGALGALDTPSEERQKLAKLSQDWTCPTCAVKNSELLTPLPPTAGSSDAIEESREATKTESVAQDEGNDSQEQPVQEKQDSSAPSVGEVSTTPTGRIQQQPEPIPTPTTRPPRNVEKPPVWIDRAIAGLVLMLVILLLRKVGGLGKEAGSVGITNKT